MILEAHGLQRIFPLTIKDHISLLKIQELVKNSILQKGGIGFLMRRKYFVESVKEELFLVKMVLLGRFKKYLQQKENLEKYVQNPGGMTKE